MIIDGSGFLFRAFYALPALTTSQGVPVGALVGFANMLLRVQDQYPADRCVVVLDKGRCTFRTALDPAYKACRPDPDPDIIRQFDLVRQFCAVYGMPVLQSYGIEADDLIATAAYRASADGWTVTVVSSDKDLSQVVTDTVHVYDPVKRRTWTPKTVHEGWGVPAPLIPDVQALAGDASDGIPGLPGIGIKTAIKWIQHAGSLTAVLDHPDQVASPKKQEMVKEKADVARRCYQLALLRTNVPVDTPFDQWGVRCPDRDGLTEFLALYELDTLRDRLVKKGVLTAPEPHDDGDIPESTVRNAPVLAPFPVHLTGAVLPEHPPVHTGLESSGVDNNSGARGPLTQRRPGSVNGMPVSDDGRTPGALGADRHGCTPTASVSAHRGPVRMHGMIDLCQISTCSAVAWMWDDDANEMVVCWKPGHVGRLHPEHAALLWNDHRYLKIVYHAKQWMKWAKDNDWPDTMGAFDDVMVMSYCAYGGHVHHDWPDVVRRTHADVPDAWVPETMSIDSQVHMLYQAYDFLCSALRHTHSMMAYYGIDRPLIPVLFRMEQQGVMVDTATLRQLHTQWGEQLAVLEQDIVNTAGIDFNVASPKQLGDVLFNDLKWPHGKKGKSGAYNTSSDVLHTLANAGYDLASTILKWRKLHKLNSTYTLPLADQVHATTQRLHTTYCMVTTSTGRLSSVQPNVQNIPIRTAEGRLIRHAFTAPAGHGLLCLDYSQIELRLLADMGPVPALQQAFHDGVDIHQRTAADLFDCDMDAVTTDQRRRAKTINFGIIYGISAFGLAQQLAIDTADAKAMINRYLNQYTGVKQYIERCTYQAQRCGYVTTLWGRRCFVPGIVDSSAFVRAAAERQAINAPLQGTNADLIKNAMVRIDDYVHTHDVPAHMVLQVHDELVFQVPTDQWVHVRDILVPLMQGVASLSVPLHVTSHFNQRWA